VTDGIATANATHGIDSNAQAEQGERSEERRKKRRRNEVKKQKVEGDKGR